MRGGLIVVCPEEGSPEAAVLAVRVAGVPLVTRALRTARHAGAGHVWVVASPGQRRALGPLAAEPGVEAMLTWVRPEDGAALPAAGVVLSPLVVLSPDALRAWLASPVPDDGAVAAQEAESGPVVAGGPALRDCVAAVRKGLDAVAGFLRAASAAGRVAWVPGPDGRALVVRSAAAARAAVPQLLRGLRSPQDGPLVDRYVNRTFSAWISRAAVRGPISANQVTLASLATGLVAALFLARSGSGASLLGLLLFQLSAVLDHADGEIARLRLQFSPFGKWLDNWSDHAVDVAAVSALAWRAARGGAAVLWPALFAVAGLTGGFLVVFVWTLRGAPKVSGLGARLVSMASRDGFYLALWTTVLLGQPELLLWGLALGGNAYWVLWLLAIGIPRATRPR